LLHRSALSQDAYLNDTLFLSLINVVDYSILVGVDEENRQLVVGIIDYLRQVQSINSTL
jgi:1-phosphatidylinositol-3-phosphate 5-kinase